MLLPVGVASIARDVGPSVRDVDQRGSEATSTSNSSLILPCCLGWFRSEAAYQKPWVEGRQRIITLQPTVDAATVEMVRRRTLRW